MSLLASPSRWLGTRGRPTAAAVALAGLVLLATVPLALDEVSDGVAAASRCQQTGPPGCAPTVAKSAWLILAATLAGGAGAVLAAAGLACLVRRQGTLDAQGRQLLDDAKGHFMAGTLSAEAFQATRDRLHRQAESHHGPQVALGLGLLAGLWALLAAALAVAGLAMLDLAGRTTPTAARSLRLALLAPALCTAGLVALALSAALQAGAAGRLVRTEALKLRDMLRDLEFDILDEVRRSPRRRPASQPPLVVAAEPGPVRPAP
ncbi:MAG TPA: hypothetical protein VM286_02975 [Candidatus Thermoplasmatota archaeon]|nr:hypothetical protein [Candidatus Thermoplasmatota archaeon]